MAVTDFTTAHAALRLGLSRGERREVIVQQETHLALVEYFVDNLLVQLRTERTGRKRLGLATRKDGRSVGTRQRTYFAPDGTDVRSGATVETLAFVQHATAHGIALHVVVVTVNHRVLLCQFVFRQVSVCFGIRKFEVLADFHESILTGMLVAVAFLGDTVRCVVTSLLHFFAQVLIVHLMAILPLHFLTGFLLQLFLEAAHRFDGLMGYLQGVEQVLFGHFLHLAFHHHDVLFRGTHHDVHVGLFQLGESRIDHILAVDACHTHFGYRAFKRYIGNCQCGRCGKTGQCIRHVHAIGRIQNHIHINFCVIIAGEQGTQSAVHQAAGQNLIVRSLTLTLGKTSGETAGSGEFLSVLYLQRHKICSGNGIFGGTDSGQEHRVAHSEHNGSIGLFGQFPGLDADGSPIRQFDCFLNYVHLVS